MDSGSGVADIILVSLEVESARVMHIEALAAQLRDLFEGRDSVPSRCRDRLRRVHDRVDRKAFSLEFHSALPGLAGELLRAVLSVLADKLLRIAAGKVHDLKAVAVRVSQFDGHIYFAALSGADLLAVLYKRNVKKPRILEHRSLKAQRLSCLLREDLIFGGLVGCIVVQLSSRRNPRVAPVCDLHCIIVAVTGQDRLLDRRSDDAVDGEFIRFKFDLVDLERLLRFRASLFLSGSAVLRDLIGSVAGVVSGARLDLEPVLGLHFRLDELGPVLFLLIKMNGVQTCVCSHLHRFVVFDAHCHLACRLYFDPVVQKAYIVEPREGHTGVLVVLVPELLLRLVKIQLILLFVALLRDLADLKYRSFRKFSLHGDRYIDFIITALCGQLGLLRDELCVLNGRVDGRCCGRCIRGGRPGCRRTFPGPVS